MRTHDTNSAHVPSNVSASWHVLYNKHNAQDFLILCPRKELIKGSSKLLEEGSKGNCPLPRPRIWMFFIEILPWEFFIDIYLNTFRNN